MPAPNKLDFLCFSGLVVAQLTELLITDDGKRYFIGKVLSWLQFSELKFLRINLIL